MRSNKNGRPPLLCVTGPISPLLVNTSVAFATATTTTTTLTAITNIIITHTIIAATVTAAANSLVAVSRKFT